MFDVAITSRELKVERDMVAILILTVYPDCESKLGRVLQVQSRGQRGMGRFWKVFRGRRQRSCLHEVSGFPGMFPEEQGW